ncbi:MULTISPECIES: hypothetical protein [unclassified Shewanella]|uniref:hypothetical protein n=1 Tax=unclassified Shewanella TaxID=196818 RepID=UPI000C868406|nr:MULTISPECIES: hypothetical protein [unclassified Shewanella]MDO6679647.1 hypothetical protein [Shewanella sp. 4_MG-2023]PMH98575.1 hypothetical protein BCU55_15550 [Shewanella sp. 10N.286.48.A6]
MTEEYKEVGQFAPRESRKELAETATVDHREHARISLRESQEELSRACDGISVKLHQKSWFLMEELGIANIKDISLSGVGLITPLTLELESIVWVEIKQQFFEFAIKRQYPINQRLTFIGGQWISDNQAKLTKLLAEINNLKITNDLTE